MFKRFEARFPLASKRVIAFVMALTAVAAMASIGSAQSLENPLSAILNVQRQEGPKIVDVRVNDTRYLSKEEILNQFKYIAVGQPYDIDKVIEDLQSLLEYEVDGERVFYDVYVQPVSTLSGVVLQLEFIEAWPVTEVTVDIDVLSEEWFLAAMEFEPGMSVVAVDEGILKAFERAELEEGFLLHLVDLQDDVATGARHLTVRAIRLSEVAIEGNQKTRDYVIERELKAAPGEPLNWHVIQGDMWRLIHLGFFKNIGEPKLEWVFSEDPNELPTLKLTYVVEERQTGSAGFGAGYSSSSGLMGYIEIFDDNLFGRGQQAGLRWEFGQKESSYDLYFREPNVLGSGVSTGFSLYNQTNKGLKDKANKEYDLRKVGGSLSIGYRFTDFLRGDLQYRHENQHRTFENEPTESHRLRSLLLGLSGDTTNQPFYPTTGLRYSVSVENAGNFLGGDLNFTKYRGSVSTYFKVGRNDQVLALRLMGGFAGSELPDAEAFRVGGADSVRGYRFGQMRGDKQLVANVEYRFHISDVIQGVVFADAGQAWDYGEPVDLSELRTAYGIGVRVDTPLGLMRLDYGFGDDGGHAYFSLGPMF